MPSYFLMTGGSRSFLAAIGILTIVIGAILFLFPGQALRFSIYLFGFFAIGIAIVLFVISAGMSRSGGLLAIPLTFGILALVIGLVSLFRPDVMGLFLAVVIALLAILAGLAMIFSAIFSLRSTIFRLLAGIVGILLTFFGIGTFFFTGYTAELMVKLVGLVLICAGAISLVAAIAGRRRSGPVLADGWEQN